VPGNSATRKIHCPVCGSALLGVPETGSLQAAPPCRKPIEVDFGDRAGEEAPAEDEDAEEGERLDTNDSYVSQQSGIAKQGLIAAGIIFGVVLLAGVGGGIAWMASKDNASTPFGKESKRATSLPKPTTRGPFDPFEQKGQEAGACLGCGACGSCAVFAIVIPIALLILHIALLVWVARDAKARGMDSSVGWIFLILLIGVIGLIIYLFSRPQGTLIRCTACGNNRLSVSKTCPHCGNH
jgi:hypothetical protein